MRTIRKIEQNIPRIRKRKKVAAYARVSMESERMQHSLSAQVSYYSSLIQKNPDWEYAGVYADYGISGTGIKKRQDFLRMMKDAETLCYVCDEKTGWCKCCADSFPAESHVSSL